MFETIREMADSTSEVLGEKRLAWLRALPAQQIEAPIALVHASPANLWHAPNPDAGDDELLSIYWPLGQRIAVHGHIHRPYIRRLAEIAIVNTGSVSLSYDGDPRASYLLLNEGNPEIRRVEYDIDKEAAALFSCKLPHAEWVVSMLKQASFQMPQG